MALVTATPLIIDAAGIPADMAGACENTANTSFGGNGQFFGPYLHGTNLYIVLTRGNNSPPAFFKSTDNGDSYALVGIISDIHFDDGFVCTYDSVRGIIRVLCFDQSGDFPFVFIFTCGADTIGTPGAMLSDNGDTAASTAQIANGNQFAIYDRSATGNFGYAIWDSASWNSPADLWVLTDDAANPQGASALADSSDRVHIVFQRNPHPVSNGYELRYAQLDASGTIVIAPTILVSINQIGPPGYSTGQSSIWNSRLAIPFMNGATTIPQILLGTPLGTPVWTIEDVDAGAVAPVSNTGTQQRTMTTFVDSDGNLRYFWIVTRSADNLYQIWMNIRTVSGWGTPQLFYDFATNPPPGATDVSIGQRCERLSSIQLASGRILISFACVFPSSDVTGPSISQVQVLLDSAPPPLTLPCPLSAPGTVGEAFTETLIASGGVPPYTYSVVPGYSLTPGLSLDPVTGIISGIPTAEGTFNIAFKVTDSVGNTATT